jgi:hypothetical protein
MLSFKEVIISAAKASGLSAVINSILFYAFRLTNIITDDILLEPAKEPMSLVPIVLASIVPCLLSAPVLYLLLRYTKRGFQIFRIVAIILLVASFANPFFGIPGVTLSYAIALNLMHVVVVTTLIYFYNLKMKSLQNA